MSTENNPLNENNQPEFEADIPEVIINDVAPAAPDTDDIDDPIYDNTRSQADGTFFSMPTMPRSHLGVKLFFSILGVAAIAGIVALIIMLI